MLRSLRCSFALALILLAPAAALAQTQTHGLVKGYMDTSCAPCKDFFRYANGVWADSAKIPPAYNGIGAGREIYDRNQEVLHGVLDRVSANAATEKDPDLRKVGQLYSVLMDSTRADREGAQPLAEMMKRIDGIQNKQQLQAELARLGKLGFNVPFGIGPEADPKQSTMNIGQLWQGGMGMPERDYYFRTDPKSDTLRQEYVKFMTRVFVLLQVPADKAAADAKSVMALETALAESALTRVEMRDPLALYNKMTVKQLGAIAPAIDWTGYFGAVGLKQLAASDAMVDVSMPRFMKHMSGVFEATPLDTWKAKLKFDVARAGAGWLSKDFFDAQFAYQSKLSGAKVPLPRWKRAAQSVDNNMGEALGKAYVATEFPPSSKTRMMEMVTNLQAAYAERIKQLDWMSEPTKKQALTKLDAILKKIGYPDKWRDYSALAIDPSVSAGENLRRCAEFDNARELAKIGKPVDRTEWGMSPPTVNAYYNPSINEIVFPAGILQPPQFDPLVDDAVNYGAIGMVIGHEVTHGFDDEGRQYDAVGNLKDWWTADDAKKFTEKADRVVKQYDGYVAVDTLHVNGKLTLGENLADLGGLTLAYHAWKLSLKGKPAPQAIDGFTPEQRFFLGYAQAWRRKIRPESIRNQVLSDPHSPAEWRVNGPVSNMQEFRDAFGCKAGDALVRADDLRAVIW